MQRKNTIRLAFGMLTIGSVIAAFAITQESAGTASEQPTSLSSGPVQKCSLDPFESSDQSSEALTAEFKAEIPTETRLEFQRDIGEVVGGLDSVAHRTIANEPKKISAANTRERTRRQTPSRERTESAQPVAASIPWEAPQVRANDELLRLQQWSLRAQAQARAEAQQHYRMYQQQSYQAQQNANNQSQREMNRFRSQLSGRMAARGVQW